ncbi:hypothetical protein IOD16_01800 [Saccharothrix sp. 6-C]|uniref:hypothetical protein n=1 Tax=Saccharothrix sp. 6-C TaxID=2781735 RepID=UPI0019173AB6|nr:hypothetical protein [Saccharothrix sp. 6-C]QQQ77313.1 hypothetical protein IOD16_01800 [Saccharothrix sp. 6-C]
MRRAAGPPGQFGTGVALEHRAARPDGAVETGAGRRPVVVEPLLCREARGGAPSAVHLALCLALLCFAVAISML